MTFLSGKNGAATINGIEVPLVEWTASPASQTTPFRNSKSGTFTLVEPTFQSATFEFSIDYDFDANPFLATPGLTVGSTLSAVKLFLNGTSGDYWDAPSLVVTQTPQQLVVDGKITTRVVGLTSGPFGYPGSPVGG